MNALFLYVWLAQEHRRDVAVLMSIKHLSKQTGVIIKKIGIESCRGKAAKWQIRKAMGRVLGCTDYAGWVHANSL